eukprot:TRINITY_DN1155_c0_g4_i1.p1 TRINITY_DN1155_c0_g4~~TRINITY_DN1155_c0_g4_i1.p1  ORF type:complete len:128 (+),score=15.73 TRINITY_DN1155_c0_g4_i1:765-1148(+)
MSASQSTSCHIYASCADAQAYVKLCDHMIQLMQSVVLPLHAYMHACPLSTRGPLVAVLALFSCGDLPNTFAFSQIDTAWKKDPGFVYFDFNKLDDVPAELHGTFAMVVIDPPFIMREVWEAYAKAST